LHHAPTSRPSQHGEGLIPITHTGQIQAKTWPPLRLEYSQQGAFANPGRADHPYASRAGGERVCELLETGLSTEQ
jgi:hypothetical protein